MLLRGSTPEAPQEHGDDLVLSRLGHLSKIRPWLTSLKEHRLIGVVRIEKSHGRIAIPEAEAVNLVFSFHMRQANLQDGEGPIRTANRSDPGRTHSLER